jgi:hypothetical protein
MRAPGLWVLALISADRLRLAIGKRDPQPQGTSAQ